MYRQFGSVSVDQQNTYRGYERRSEITQNQVTVVV